MGKLTAVGLNSALKKPGIYHDGDGLMLVVRGPNSASWIARLQHDRRRREFGLGSAKDISLYEARERCRLYRKELRAGGDPLVLDRRPKGTNRLFKDTALSFLSAKLAPEHRVKAQRRLEMHVFPRIGRLQLQSVNADIIADCLAPIWQTKPVTALKLRNYIVRTLRFGREDGALLIGQLSRAVSDRLPQQPRGKHHEAMPYDDVPHLFSRLEGKGGAGSLALRLAILCANRSQEVRGATWAEFDLENDVWTVPAARMKGGKIHRIPLSNEARAVLDQASEYRRRDCDLVFPNASGNPLSDMTLTKALRDLGETATQHGFRSSFRDWAAEQTSVQPEVAEAALAHQVENAVERAYRRTDFFNRRRELMAAWGRFVGAVGRADVINLATAKVAS